jgi:hypothetical protein
MNSPQKKGEGDMLVQIKRNHDRVRACDRHEFAPQPNWREAPILTRLKVKCTRCDGEMNAGDMMTYLRGYAHGTGQDFDAMVNAVLPPDAGHRDEPTL